MQGERKTHRGVVLALAVVASFSSRKTKVEVRTIDASEQLEKLGRAGINIDDFFPIGCGPIFEDFLRFFWNLHESLSSSSQREGNWKVITRNSPAHNFCKNRVKKELIKQPDSELEGMMKILEVDNAALD